MDDCDSPVTLRKKHVVLRLCFRCSLTYNDSRRFDWWYRLRDILAGVSVHLCCNQSAPDRFWVLWRPFHVRPTTSRKQFPDSELWLLAAGWIPPPPASQCSQAPQSTFTHLLSVKQVNTLGSVVFLVPVNDSLNPLSLVVGHPAKTINLCWCHPLTFCTRVLNRLNKNEEEIKRICPMIKQKLEASSLT